MNDLVFNYIECRELGSGAYICKIDLKNSNVGIPVPVGFIPFSGHKQSFFGDLHCLGKDAYRFFTESKSVTQHWFDEEEMKAKEVDTWDGLL